MDSNSETRVNSGHSEGVNSHVTLFSITRAFATDQVILNLTAHELASPLLTITPHQREDVSAIDRFNVHSCPTRWVFSGTGHELMSCLPCSDNLTTGLPKPLNSGYKGKIKGINTRNLWYHTASQSFSDQERE
ncbi:hypothetical protein TNCV_3414161 [Trichonephila clavipes]|uniref:Uncharacterized protein n=1 Tax=Trichonephila clavipes TaxID=2585209 RepID=A0A8X6RK61_TRICX|nr:hypothetical protein TNCV_3414161 [Trichonephila clavipes]